MLEFESAIYHILGMSLDTTRATKIESAEDAFGDEVYYKSVQSSAKSLKEIELDEGRV